MARGVIELSPSRVELPVEKLAKLPAWKDVRKLFRAEYDRQRDAKREDKPSGPSGRRLSDRGKQGGIFVAIDAEGINIGPPRIVKEKGKNKGRDTIYQKQHTVLWMAGGVEGFEDQILARPDGCGREEIWEFLLSLPRKFASKNPSDPEPIFVGFGFDYDLGQLAVGISYKKGWELYTGVPWKHRHNENYIPSSRHITLIGNYAISQIPHKSVTLYRLRDPSKPYKYVKDKETGEPRYDGVDWNEKIQIYDTRGFFQSNLITAIKNFPGVVSEDEFKIIQEGKKKRGEFTSESVDMLKIYTRNEIEGARGFDDAITRWA